MVDDREEEDEKENGEEQSEHPQIKEQDGQMSPDDRNNFRWYTVSVSGRDKILDLKLLEPYMKVISHGGKAAHGNFFFSWPQLFKSWIGLSTR